MGRRSQKSRTGQAKDRAKRTAKESGSPIDDSDKPSVAEEGDSDADSDTESKPSEAEHAASENDADTTGKLSEAEHAASENDADTTGKSSQAEHAASEDSDDLTDISSEAGKTDSLAGDGTPRNNTANEVLDGELDDDIAAGYASIEVEQAPQTCCSNCMTIFEVSPELLSSSDTRVRCGECLGIFDALANLRHLEHSEGDDPDSEPSEESVENGGAQSVTGVKHSTAVESNARDASTEGTAAYTNSLDVTYADFSLFSADAALPEIDYLDETREVPAFDFDDTAGDGDLDETFSETMFAHGPEVDARSAINDIDNDNDNAEKDESNASATSEDNEGNTFAAGHTTAGDMTGGFETMPSDTQTDDDLDELVGSLRGAEFGLDMEERPGGSWWLRSALLLLILSLAAGLYGYRERESLQHSQYLRPALETLCSVIGCTLAEPVDLASLQVFKRSVFSHPKLNNVLVINIGFVNQAAFHQRYPVLEIRLTDRNGGLVVKNSFEPSDYLDNWQPGDVLDAGKRLDISLNVQDPGNEAMSFELDFR